jgi:hypothetical protein
LNSRQLNRLERQLAIISAWSKGIPLKVMYRMFKISKAGVYYILKKHKIQVGKAGRKFFQLELFK